MKNNIEMNKKNVVADPIQDYREVLLKDPETLKEIVEDTVEVVNNIGTGLFSELSYALGRWFW